MTGAARQTPIVVWFRDDLRLHDHPALAAAAAAGRPLVPLYVLETDVPLGRGARWWLHGSLAALAAELQARGSALVLARGPAAEEVPRVARATGARTVTWNRRWSPAGADADRRTAAALATIGVEGRDHAPDLVAEPDAVATGEGNPYRVFTPFWKKLSGFDPGDPVPAPDRLRRPGTWPAGPALADLELRGESGGGFAPARRWTPGETGAAAAWDRFRTASLEAYAEERDRPDRRGTARLSPHLRWGEISVRELWRDAAAAGAEPWRRQLAWREFAHHLLYHFPATATAPLNPRFADFPWMSSEHFLGAWRRGQTGYPFVDAGLRELASTGWMHNRVRMVAASFLVKHLLVPWQDGAAWFMENLVDADPANNVFGWQWTAGCGADAAPWFRIFNPVAQGKRHDPEGAYIRRWVPELADLPRRWVHAPWLVPRGNLAAAGVELGTDYPAPLVDHEEARQRALDAWQKVRRR